MKKLLLVLTVTLSAVLMNGCSKCSRENVPPPPSSPSETEMNQAPEAAPDAAPEASPETPADPDPSTLPSDTGGSQPADESAD